MYNPPGRPQHPSHSRDSHIRARSGIAGSWVRTTLKHSEEPVVKKATTTHVSTGTCDSSRYSTFSPALTGGGHSEKEPVKSNPHPPLFMAIDHSNDLCCLDEAWHQTSGGCIPPQCVHLPYSSLPHRNLVSILATLLYL